MRRLWGWVGAMGRVAAAAGSWVLQPPDAPVMKWPNETGEDA